MGAERLRHLQAGHTHTRAHSGDQAGLPWFEITPNHDHVVCNQIGNRNAGGLEPGELIGNR